MDNIHHNTGGNWPPVDYSIRNTVTLSNFDTSGSIILNVGPSQTMQLVPSAAHSSVSQMIHQQPSSIMHPISHNHHQHQQHQMQNTAHTIQGVQHAMLTTNPVCNASSTQLQVGQLLPTILQPSSTQSVLVANQHMTSNMMWQNSAPTQTPLLAVQQMHQPSQHSGHLVNVAVQTAIIDDHAREQSVKFNHNSQPKVLNKKRQSKQESERQSVPDKKKGKFVADRKKIAVNISTNKVKGSKFKKKNSDKIDGKRKRASNPEGWKKNIRKLMRVQGKGYVNTKGIYVPPKTRKGPPCNCRMRCYDSIPEEECNEIFERFFKIGDKDIQDALLYSLITKETPKHRRAIVAKGEDQVINSIEPSTTKHNIRNATFLYHVQCKEGILRVCSSAFMSIYGATQKRVRRLQQHKFIDPLNPPRDLRGKHGNQKMVGMIKAKQRREKQSGCNTAINLVKNVGSASETNIQTQNSPEQRLNNSSLTAGLEHENSLRLKTTHQGQHPSPVDFSVWNNVTENSQQQNNPIPETSLNQTLKNTNPDTAVEMTSLDSSGFLSGFLLGASGEDFKSAVAKFNASSVSCAGASTSKGHINHSHTSDYNKQALGSKSIKLPDSIENLLSETCSKLPDSIENLLSETCSNLIKEKGLGKQLISQDKANKKRSRHPELWKKNIRKNNRAHGMAYINSKGKYVAAKSRTGPPCKCRMRCYLRITEEECNTIFRDFHRIGDKNVQDGILYNLMIHKEVKHHKKNKKSANPSETCAGSGDKLQPHSHADFLELIFSSDKEADGNSSSELQENFVRNLVNNTTEFSAEPQTNQNVNSDSNKLNQIEKLHDDNLNSILNLSTSQPNHGNEADASDNNCGDKSANSSNFKTKCPRDRQSTFWYYVQQNSGLVRVCSNAFMSIYGATQKRLRRLQQHKVTNPITPPKDMRGKHGSGGPANKPVIKSISSSKTMPVEKKKPTYNLQSLSEPSAVYLPDSVSQTIVLPGGSSIWQSTLM